MKQRFVELSPKLCFGEIFQEKHSPPKGISSLKVEFCCSCLVVLSLSKIFVSS